MTVLTRGCSRWADAMLYGLLTAGVLDAAYFAVFCMT